MSNLLDFDLSSAIKALKNKEISSFETYTFCLIKDEAFNESTLRSDTIRLFFLSF